MQKNSVVKDVIALMLGILGVAFLTFIVIQSETTVQLPFLKL